MSIKYELTFLLTMLLISISMVFLGLYKTGEAIGMYKVHNQIKACNLEGGLVGVKNSIDGTVFYCVYPNVAEIKDECQAPIIQI